MAAAGTEPAGRKRIPRRAAAFEEVLRVIAVAAIPAAGCLWTPFTEWATNPAKLWSVVVRCSFLGCFRRLQSFLKKPEHYREMQQLEQTFLLQNHFFTRLRDALRQVFEKKIFNPGSVVGGQLTVGELLVEPKFSVGIFRQGLLQQTGVGKGDHGISRRVDQEDRNFCVADSIRRRRVSHVDAEKKLRPDTDEICNRIIEQWNRKELESHVRETRVT